LILQKAKEQKRLKCRFGGKKTLQKPVAFSFIVIGIFPDIDTKIGDPN